MESCPSTNWCRISQPSVLPMVNPFFIHLHTMGIQLPWGHILTQVIQAALLQFYRKSGEDLHWIQTSRAHPLLNRHVVHDLGQELTNSLEVRFWSSRDNQFGVATRCLFLCWWGYFRRLWTSCLLKMGCYKSWTDLNAGKIGWNSPLTTTSRSRAPWVNICSHHLFCWCCWWTARLHREGCILWFLDDVFHIDGFPLLKPWLSKVSQWGCEAGGRWTETAMASQLAGTQRPAPKWATSNCIWWVSSQMYNTFIYITYDPPKDYSPNSQALASKKGMWMAINP